MNWTATLIGMAALACLGGAVIATGFLDSGPDTVLEAPALRPVVLPLDVQDDGPPPVLLMRATNPEEVREVLRFTRTATSRDEATLRRAALEAHDPLVCGNALKALGRIKRFSADEALLALMTDPRPRVRQDAVTACGLDGRDLALPHLERALEAGDAQTRPLILRSLGQIGGERARALLVSVEADSEASETDRVFARTALLRMEG